MSSTEADLHTAAGGRKDHARHVDHGHELSFIRKYVFSTDHKIIGIQFLFTGLTMFILGGLLAMAVRLNLASPSDLMFGPILGLFGLASENQGKFTMTGDTYNMLFTMHASIMIFLVIIPLLTGAFGNYLIPLQIGARDMAFPRLNMLAYWLMWPGIAILVSGFFVEGGHAGAGWTAYPTLSTGAYSQSMGQTLWLMGVFVIGSSSIMGAVNYLTTIVKLRAPGMALFRMPLSVWALFITSILVLLGTPVLASALFMLTLDRTLGTTFFSVEGGGQPLLWQHLFWFYSHPAVYIMILPAMGFVSDILSTFSRKPIFGYKPMIYAIAAIAGLGFIVWGHHMFQSGMNPALGMTFMLSTTMIALPSAIKTFNWISTLWRGNLHFTSAMWNALAFVSMFIIGGLSGIYMASTPVDIYIHDTYYIVGHIHYVLFGGSMFGLFAAIFYWFPKMFGRMMHEGLGKVHFWLTFVFFNVTFFPMHIIGMAGHPRRIAFGWDEASKTGYAFLRDVQYLNVVMTYGAICLGITQILLFVNFFWSLFKGKKAPQNPWHANSLEWAAAPSPPPHLNWGPTVPTVYRGPYEYASPLVEEDYLPQNRKLETA
ncbi:MAG: cbb3-type cytochrome c oxidase subunit I [Planctomycetota bacterium]